MLVLWLILNGWRNFCCGIERSVDFRHPDILLGSGQILASGNLCVRRYGQIAQLFQNVTSFPVAVHYQAKDKMGATWCPCNLCYTHFSYSNQHSSGTLCLNLFWFELCSLIVERNNTIWILLRNMYRMISHELVLWLSSWELGTAACCYYFCYCWYCYYCW